MKNKRNTITRSILLSILLCFVLQSTAFAINCQALRDSLNYAWKNKSTDYEEALKKISDISTLAEESACPAVKGKALNYLGWIFLDKGYFKKSEEKLREALQMREQLKDSTGIASVLNNLAMCKQGEGYYTQAIEYAIRGIELLDKIENKKNIGELYNTLSIIYGKIKDWDKAIAFNKKALDILISNKDTIDITNSRFDLANKYFNFKDFEQAKINYKAALEGFLAWPKVDSIGVAMCYEAIGNVFVELDSFSNAEKNFFIANEIYSNSKDTIGLFYVNFNLSNLFLEAKYPDKALHHCKLSEKYLSFTGGLENEKNIEELYGKIFFLKKDFEKAISHNSKAKVLKDSIFNLEKSKQITEIQTKYDTEKLKRENSEKELEIQRKNAQQNAMIGASLLLLFLVIASVIYFKKRQQTLKIINAQQKQIHEKEVSGILKNQEVQFVVERLTGRELERKEFYNELHHNIGNQIVLTLVEYKNILEQVKNNSLRKDLEKANQSLNKTYEEVTRLHEKIGLGNVNRIGIAPAINDLCEASSKIGKFEVEFSHYGAFESLNPDIELWLYRITQELFSNILKYANATEVEVSLNLHSDKISLMVTDNGKGFDKKELNKGTGLNNLTTKVESMEGTFDIDTTKNVGTTVIVNIPLNDY